jgi:hypothetical protein
MYSPHARGWFVVVSCSVQMIPGYLVENAEEVMVDAVSAKSYVYMLADQ